MSAANSDLVRNAAPNFATTLANSMLISDNTMTLSSVTGLPTNTGITLVIDATDPVSGAATPALKEVVTGVVSGSTVTSLLRGKDGTSAIAHASGANVVMWITANLWNDWQTSYLTEHTQAGAHAMTSPKIITNVKDTNGNAVLAVNPASSAVNELQITNAATGAAPVLGAAGSDNNIGITITPKGTGATTINNLFNPYKFFAYRNAAYSPASNIVLILDTKAFDTGTNFSVATGLFTAPVAGFYQFDGSINLTGGNTLIFAVGLAKNGTEYTRGDEITATGTVAYGITVGRTIQLAANDTVGLFFGSSNGGTTALGVGTTPIQTCLSGFMVSAT